MITITYKAWIVSLAVVVLALAALLFARMRSFRRERRRADLRAHLDTIVRRSARGETVETDSAEARALSAAFTVHCAIDYLGDLLRCYSVDERLVLGAAFRAIDYDTYLVAQLAQADTARKALIIRILGILRMHRGVDAVVQVMRDNPAHLDIQYLGLLLLSVTGDEQTLVGLLADESYNPLLSFRSFAEIAKAFHGDKDRLYWALLETDNELARRAALKRIGAEKRPGYTAALSAFAADAATPIDVRIDVLRTFGLLGERGACLTLEAATHDADWRIRNVAYVAIAQIGCDGCEQLLLSALRDQQWWVRSNSAHMLAERTTDDAEMRAQVEALRDCYALEAYEYALACRRAGVERR